MAIITGTVSNDSLAGTTGADQIYGREGNDTLLGNAGNDLLEGGAGADILNGGAGTDTATYANSATGVNINLTTGIGLGGDAQGDTLTAIEIVVGSAFNDTLTSANSLHTLQGGAGDDVYVVGISGVVVTEAANSGIDEVQTSVGILSIAAYDNVENLTYTGSAAFTGTGNASNNIITGGVGSDALRGAAGNDQLIGGAGNDTLFGGAGADDLQGGAGIDTASYADSATGVTINLKTGIHSGFAAGDTFNSIEAFVGSMYDKDFFTGDASANNFNGNTGAGDTIDYSISSAAVNVNLTTNVVFGGDAQGDTIAGFERVIGSAFSDTLSSSNSTHTLQGGAGDDLYILGSNSIVVTESAGNGTDEVQTALGIFTIADYANVENLTYTGTSTFNATGNDSDNIITGGTANDSLRGRGGNDLLIGGAGNDTLFGGAGADTLQGGEGTDTATFIDSATGVTVNLKTGLHGGTAAGDVYDSIEAFIGSNFADSFAGDASANSFNGGAGIDTIDYSSSAAAVNVNLTTNAVSDGDAEGDTIVAFEKVIGSAFNDTLTSSTASHTLQGGAGDDVYIVGAATVVITEAAGSGIDEVRTGLGAFSLATSSNVENLTYTGTAAFTGTGNAGDNSLTGGIGNDVFYGGAGADQFHGGAGNDAVSYIDSAVGVTVNLKTGIHSGIAAGDTFDSIEVIQGSNFSDTFVGDAGANSFDGNAGLDAIDYSSSAAAVSVNLTTNIVAGGDAQGDTLTEIEKVIGSAFDDTLASSTASTNLQGGAGNDIYIVGAATVMVTEAAGDGIDEVRTALTTFSLKNISNVENLTYTGTLAFTGTGNAGDNIITGGAGNDVFIGGAGADEFHGGAGTDTVSFADGGPLTFNFATGDISGVGQGDTFYDIERFQGSVYADKFIESGAIHQLDGGTGVDTVSYETATSGITVDLGTLNHTGIATGDIFTSIEVIQATSFADVLVGDGNANIFIGGAGADAINGGAGSDSAWYLSSASAVHIDLLAGTATGGEAQGDILSSIENLIGTTLDDILIGNAADNTLEGGAGNDTINGGDGADLIFGGVESDVGIFAAPITTPQADVLHGENGNDVILTKGDDAGSFAFGDAGNDTLVVTNGNADGGIGSDTITVKGAGVAHGGDGVDTFTGAGNVYTLYGDAGADVFNLNGTGDGDAYGGEDGDVYNVNGTGIIHIKDTGTTGIDSLYLNNIATLAEIYQQRIGDDLYITSQADVNDNGKGDSGVLLLGWYNGGNTLEFFFTADNVVHNF